MKLPFPIDGNCNPKACVQGDVYRFTLLTPRILRMEYDPEGIFEDRPSQTVVQRNFPAPEFHVRDNNGCLEIDSHHFHLIYYYGKDSHFTENTLIIDAKNNFSNYGARWHFGTTTYGDPPRHHNLYGTSRTLDKANGKYSIFSNEEIPLERGLMDSSGHSFFDDSQSALLGEDGQFYPRRPDTMDVYYVCCQHDYKETLQDFYQITGRPPMLPRYALGNWWSRWYPYTEETYLALFDRFEREDIPFSMAVLDMDWHITKVDPKYGKGWTGYTWNKTLFPDPKAFAKRMHEKGAHISLNLHPADGVQAFEDAYPQMAAATGANAEKEEPVIFDMTDPVFTKAYFDHLMHPLEEDGVDHWWIDWQQGRKCAVPGIDPLWLLNHYHYVDNCRDGNRGMILSRYCGFGGHRYPVGFSGDTIVSWESLDYQAYFTATSTNAGFCFWSHDIGGFMRGIRDPELFVRWLQLGAFSPFLRLHSTRNPFASKEPWNYREEFRPAIAQWLRLRHRLIPYIYTATYRQHMNEESLIRPMYYDYPRQSRSYTQNNQYMFGSELMVCPITAPADDATGMGSVKAWIPNGIWTDFFTGKTYKGHRTMVLNRPVEQYPVLAKAGAIVPTACHQIGSSDTSNPAEMEVFVFPGASGNYTMFEDDGVSDAYTAGKSYFTQFCYDETAQTFTISSHGDASCIPANRIYKITFRGFCSFIPEGAKVHHVTYDAKTHSVSAILSAIHPGENVTVHLPNAQIDVSQNREAEILDFLTFAKLPIDLKSNALTLVQKGYAPEYILEELRYDDAPIRFLEVMTELLN